MTGQNRGVSLSRPWFRALSLVLVTLMGPVSFTAPGSPIEQLADFQSAPGIGPERAAQIVQASLGGQVLSVSSGTANGRAVYRVKLLLSGGRVKVMQVSASDGQILD